MSDMYSEAQYRAMCLRAEKAEKSLNDYMRVVAKIDDALENEEPYQDILTIIDDVR